MERVSTHASPIKPIHIYLNHSTSSYVANGNPRNRTSKGHNQPTFLLTGNNMLTLDFTTLIRQLYYCPCKSVSKQTTSTPFRITTYEKHRGEGARSLLAPLPSHAPRSDSILSALNQLRILPVTTGVWGPPTFLATRHSSLATFSPCRLRRFAANSPCISGISRLNLKGLCALRSQHPTRRRRANGHLGLEGLSHFWPDLYPYSPFFRCARRAHQFEPAPQRLPLAHQDAAVLPNLRPQGGAQRNRQGL